MSKSVSVISEQEEMAGEPCSVCREIPESIIFLTCGHTICLGCVARQFVANHKGGEEWEVGQVRCEACGVMTALSEEVQETLLEFLGGMEKEALCEGKNEIEAEELVFHERVNETNRQSESQELESSKTSFVLKPKREDSQASQKISNETKKTINCAPSPKFIPIQDSDSPQIKVKQSRTLKDPSVKNSFPANRFSKSSLSKVNEKQSNDDSLNVFCVQHPKEPCAFYCPETRDLLCPNCLLAPDSPYKKGSLRPLRKCFPEILQDIEELLSEVETGRKLLENRKKSYSLKKESWENQGHSSIKRMTRMVEMLAEAAEELRLVATKDIENSLKAKTEEITIEEQSLDKSLDYLKFVLDSVGKLKSRNLANPEVEFFSFFSNHHRNIRKTLNEELVEKASNDQEQPNAHSFFEINSKFANALEEKLQSVISILPSRTMKSQKENLINTTSSAFHHTQTQEIPAKRTFEKSMKSPTSKETLDFQVELIQSSPKQKLKKPKPFLSSSLMNFERNKFTNVLGDSKSRDTPFRRLTYNFLSKKDIDSKLKAFDFKSGTEPVEELPSENDFFFRKDQRNWGVSCSSKNLKDATSTVLKSLDFGKFKSPLVFSKM